MSTHISPQESDPCTKSIWHWEDLEVESFDTTPAGESRGTVRGHGTEYGVQAAI